MVNSNKGNNPFPKDVMPVYIDEVDRMLDQLSSKIPRTTMEIIYLSEIELQKKIYTVLIILSLMMVAYVTLL